MENATQLSNIQLELLKLFKFQASEKQLSDIKNMLSSYFAKNATEKMDSFFEKNNWNSETIEQLKNEHLRSKN